MDAQLKHIQQLGLISESDMDGMLGILERDVKEASAKLPKEKDDIVLFFGEELERSTCGASRAAFVQSKELQFPKDSVDSLLDSLKTSYKAGLSQCGVDQAIFQENSKAMEDMVARLKNAYQTNGSLCGGGQGDIIAVAASQLNTMDKQATSIVSARTMTLMDDAAVGSPSFTNLVQQLQDEQNQQLQSGGQLELKHKSVEAVDDMLKRARAACAHKSAKLEKLKKRRNKPEPQTFIVPINMPTRTEKEELEEGTKLRNAAIDP
jgi:hypothetical protein